MKRFAAHVGIPIRVLRRLPILALQVLTIAIARICCCAAVNRYQWFRTAIVSAI